MRLNQSFVVALLASAFAFAPIHVVAQGNGFLVLGYPAPEKPSIRVVNCPGIKPGQGTVTCDIVYKGKHDAIPCKPGACSFHRSPAKDVLTDLAYGVSYVNPTCVWVQVGGVYYPACW